MKRRLMAYLLVLSMLLTGLGFVPAVSAAEDDALVAKWTTKEELAPADQEILLRPEKGSLSGESGEMELAVENSRYQPNDIVTVIVELEDAPLLERANQQSMDLTSYAATAQGKNDAQALASSHANVKARLRALSGSISVQSVNGASNLEYDYTAVLNGFSMKLRYGDLDKARQVPGVKRIFVAEQYSLPTMEDMDYTISMDSSTGMVGATEANELGYDGTGTIVAILDTGYDFDHEAFSVMPTDGKYSKADVAELLKKDLSCGITNADDVYVSEKAPYAYDYAGGDTNADAVGSSHGVHVAGTVAGNNGEDFFGVAPNAQLMIMKIFADNSGSTGDDIILAGLDDAVKLGADAINMSLGSPAGFAQYGDEDKEETDGYLTYYGVYTRAQASGTSLMIAAGNETAASYMNPSGTNLTQAQYPDNGVVATPSTLEAPVSVASVDNIAYFRNHFALGEERIAYNGGVDYNAQAELDILETFEGKTLEYVPVSGLGEEKDFEGLDLTGKIALVSRGSINFDVKAANAAAVGAEAIIIYNNTDDGLFYASYQNYTIPIITIAKQDALHMMDASVKKITFSAEYYGKTKNPTAYQVSSFSSLGPAPNLTIKPEISAPGGQIYSSVIDGGYQTMSGTSMATPHMAGEAVVLRQYLMETYPEMSMYEIGQLATSLLMSTAIPSQDKASGTYFAVRRQGAGVANVLNAIESEAYLSVEGCDRPKAEVGSSKDGVFTYTVTVHNLSDTSKTYTLDTAVLADTVTEIDGVSYIANSEKRLPSSEATVTYTGLTGGKITVAAGSTATFSVKVALTASGKAYINDNFPNGGYVEGFTFLTAENENDIDLNVPFLGFYGDWESLDIFDADPSGRPNMVGTALADLDTSGYGYFLGKNATTGVYNEDKMAFAPQRGNRQLVAQVSLLRNATSFREYITDAQGNVVYDTGDLGWVRKTFARATMQGIQYTAVTYTPGWNGRVMNQGDWASDNQGYTYTIEVTPEASDEIQTKEFKFILDNTKPTVEDVKLYEENGKAYLTGIVSDNFYVQRLRVIDSTQEYWYLGEAEAFDNVSEAGAKTRFTFDVTELAAELSADGKNPGRVGLLLEDVAHNATLVFVDLGPQSMTLESCSVEVGESKQISVSIKPERLADTKLTWASQDESVATVDETGVVTGVADGETMISATSLSGLTAYARVVVGKGAPVYLTYGEAPELNDRFQTEDGLCWKVTGPDTAQLLEDQNKATAWAPSYASLTGDIVIPTTVEYGGKTFRVTSIGYQAFYMNMGITSVTIPEGVKDVGYAAFFLCDKLKNISLPDSLEKVDDMAFNTFVATAFDKVPANLKWIGESAFRKADIAVLDLPEGLTHIGNKAFYNASTIRSVSLPESVTEYGDHIFYGCSGLTYAELPANMKELPTGIFWSCTSLKRISLPTGLEKIGNGAFYGSGLERITIPASVKVIDDWAFAWLTNMKTIDIPDTVESIGMNAYIYCQGVNTINIGSGVKTIGKDGFRTWNLELGEAPVMNVKTETTATALRRSGYGQEILLNGVPYTGYNGVSFTEGDFSYMPISDTEVQLVGFNNEAAPGEFTIPAEVYCEGDDRTYTVTSVMDKVFFLNENVLKLSIPDTITDLGERAFDQMYFVCEINIPKNLKNVGYQAMGYLGWDVKEVGLEFDTDQVLEIPGTIEVWGDCGFAGNQHKTIVVGEGVESIGNYGLYDCYNATSVTLPSTLKRINNYAFQNCKALTSIDIPDGVTFIGDGAFTAVPLESIDLPEGLTYIGRDALGAYVYNADYTAQYWVGPEYVELNGALNNMGYNAFRPNAEIVAVLNSQRNMVVAFNNLENLPTVCWDGKTDIPYNDGSYVPADKELHLTENVTIDGKLTVDGKVYVPYNVYLEITDDALIVNPENIIYEGCKHENTTTVTVPATCETDGSVTVTCDDCGEVLSTEILPAHCASKAFTDLRVNQWYHPYTDYVIDNGLMNGMSNSKFNPNGETTRAMLVTTLYRMAGEPEVTELSTFTDVPKNQWYAKAVAWAQDLGIATGVTDTTFCPGKAVTREQAAAFLYRYVTLYLKQEPAKGADLSVYKDADKITGFAKEAIAWATAEGLFNGFENGTFQPKGTLTRAQMAKLLTVLDQKF